MIVLSRVNAQVRFQQLILFHIPVMDLAENVGEKPDVRLIGILPTLAVDKVDLADIKQNGDGNDKQQNEINGNHDGLYFVCKGLQVNVLIYINNRTIIVNN